MFNTDSRVKGMVLVTGATGAVGPRVVHALLRSGCRIRTFSVDAPAQGLFPPQIEIVIGDVTSQTDVERAMQGVDVVIHMAALLHIVNPPSELRERYERVNVGGTANIVACARKAGATRLVFFSTIAVYGASHGGILTEDSGPNPDSLYARTKFDAERIVLAATCKNGKPLGTVLRLGAVYGARIKGNYRKLLLALSRGRFIPIGSGQNRRVMVYDKDVAQAALLAAYHPDVAGRVFNVTDGEFHSMTTIIQTLCTALGRRPPCLMLPAGTVRALAGLIESGSRICGLCSPIMRATIDKYTEDVAVDGQMFCTQIGFSPQYDLMSGWQETVAEMRQAGELPL